MGSLNVSVSNHRSKPEYRPKVNHKLLHRLLINAPKGVNVDHIDGNPMNNQRANLRLCDQTQNNGNSKKRRTTYGGREPSSKFKGLRWKKDARKWEVRIATKGKSVTIGYFATERGAAEAYNDAAVQVFGEFARLNEF